MTLRTPRLVSLAIVPATLALALAAFAHEPATSAPAMAKHHDAASMELHKAMKMPMDAKMPGDVDRDFAAMMTMHHQQALKMADIELRSGKSPELKAMAQKMKDQQTREIAELARFK